MRATRAYSRRPHPRAACRCVGRYAGATGRLETLTITLVLAAILGGIGVAPALFVLIVALVILFTGGRLGYARGSRG